VSLAQKNQTPSGRRTVGLLIVLGLILALVTLLALGLRSESSVLLQGKSAPDFELTAFNAEHNGERFSLADLHGQVVVLNFWASWCVECDKEMALLEQAWQDYRDREVWIIGVDYLDIDTKGLAYLDRYGITYPNGPDIGSRMYQDYQCTGVPETFFIDGQGVVQHVQIGPLTRHQLYGLLDQMLQAEASQGG
jgi:cytochrome c biogenesis protein CcmG/thiol:disulfide interchange protein DsbE